MSKHANLPYSSTIVEQKKKALIIYEKETKIVSFVREELRPYFTIYEASSCRGAKQKQFDTYIFIHTFPQKQDVFPKQATVVIIRFFLSEKQYKKEYVWCTKNIVLYKYVNIGITGRSTDELLHFILFKTPTPYVFNYILQGKQTYVVKKKPHMTFRWRWPFFFFVLIVCIFITTLALLESMSAWQLYSFSKNPKEATLESARFNHSFADVLMDVPRQTLFWFPGIEHIFDTHDAIGTAIESAQNGVKTIQIGTQFAKEGAYGNGGDVQMLTNSLETLTKSLDKTITSWERPLLPGMGSYQKKIIEALTTTKEYAQIGRDIVDVLPDALGKKKEKKYLLLFMNNMELRPGGGFIGSIGIATFFHLRLTSFKVYDVYSIDGQLKTHLDPPAPIRTFLNQPHWFLRDSNTSPDFVISATNALELLDKSVGWKGFDGVFGITYSAVSSFLPAFPRLSLPDYNTIITDETFFQKAHNYARQDFFSGSHNKRNFLQAVATAIEVRVKEGDFLPLPLLESVRKALDEKHITLSFADPKTQAVVQKYFWGGQMTPLDCVTADGCSPDYLSIVDMNLGVNKANFYVQRIVRMRTELSNDGTIQNTLGITYRNDSPGEPGGMYKNYLQLYLPADSTVTNASVDGENPEELRQSLEGNYRVVGMWIVVPEGEQKQITVNYNLGKKLDTTYQLILQKQIGSINNDFVYEFNPGPSYTVVQTNFPNVVRSGLFVYNTFLERDRLLLIRLKKK